MRTRERLFDSRKLVELFDPSSLDPVRQPVAEVRMGLYLVVVLEDLVPHRLVAAYLDVPHCCRDPGDPGDLPRVLNLRVKGR